MLNSRPTLKTFFLYQSKEISVLLGWSLFFKIYSIIKKINIEVEKIKAIKKWFEFKSV